MICAVNNGGSLKSIVATNRLPFVVAWSVQLGGWLLMSLQSLAGGREQFAFANQSSENSHIINTNKEWIELPVSNIITTIQTNR